MYQIFVDAALTVLVLASLASWVLIIKKFIDEAKVTRQSRAFAELFWSSKGWTEARQSTEGQSGDLAQIAQAGFQVFDEYLSHPHSLKNAGEINEVLERPLRQKAEEILRRREKGLNEMASVGSLAPFVGLFGTVLGIMGAMQTISSSGQASIDVVAGPIGEALVATAVGIATALPAVYFYNHFSHQIRLGATDMEGFINDFLRLAVREIKKP
jgi:biopolymer transport protein ExbB